VPPRLGSNVTLTIGSLRAAGRCRHKKSGLGAGDCCRAHLSGCARPF
jgi:hypothetical protein